MDDKMRKAMNAAVALGASMAKQVLMRTCSACVSEENKRKLAEAIDARYEEWLREVGGQ